MEGLRDQSGLFAISGSRDAAGQVVRGLRCIQHRGSSGAGIAASDGQTLRVLNGFGTVEQNFGGRDLSVLRAASALGVVWDRGERADARELEVLAPRLQPAWGRCKDGSVAVAMAGRLTNGTALREAMYANGQVLGSQTDAEVLLQLLAQSSRGTLVNRLVDALWRVEGAYALVVLTGDKLIAVRDPRGFRGLWFGRLGDGFAVSTEDTALRQLGSTEVREVAPGEMWIMDEGGPLCFKPLKRKSATMCVVESVLLAPIDGECGGGSVYGSRSMLGDVLGTNEDTPLDVVVASPGSEAAALGFSARTGIRYEAAIRAQLAPSGPVETPGAHPTAYCAAPSVLEHRRVALVSTVLGDGRDIRAQVRAIRQAGPAEVHLRVILPPVSRPCPYGVSVPAREGLMALRDEDQETLRLSLGVDSIMHLSKGAVEAAWDQGRPVSPCMGCMGGDWPIDIDERDDQLGLFESGR